VPGVSPQAAVHDLALVRGIGAEAAQLPITHALEEEPDRPHRGPEVEQQPRFVALEHRHLDRQRHEPDGDGLREEDAERTAGRIGVTLEHVRVAGVLSLPTAAPRDVAGEATAPDRDQHRHEEPTGVITVARRQHERDPGDHDEAEPPRHVDDVETTDRLARQPRAEHEHQHCGGGDHEATQERTGRE